MKKFLMSLAAAAMVAVSASAQVYLGGNVGVASSKLVGGESITTYKVLPEIGYNLDNDWAIGTVAGWGKGTPVSIEDARTSSDVVGYFKVEPYVRYTFVHSKYVNVFCDGAFGYTHFNHTGNAWNAGLKPGIAVNLNKSFSFVAHAGFLGYKNYKVKGANKSSHAWGADLDGNNLTFGLNYNF